MTEPLSAAIVGAKILDILLGQAIGKGVDGLLGGASKALKDARSELEKETAQRAARMTVVVQQAAEEMQPALEQIKIDTGQDHSALFQHPPFLAQVAQALLTNLTLDVDAFRAGYQDKFGDSKWADLAEPLDMFFSQLKLLLARDTQWGPALREFRREAQQANLNASALQLVKTAEQIAQSLDDLPERTAQAAERRERMRLEAWQERYLQGLYRACNELPLERDAPIDAVTRRTFRLQHVYVDLDVQQPLTLERVLDRLQVPPGRRKEARKALMGLAPAEGGQRSWEGDLPDELTRNLAQQLRRIQTPGGEEGAEKLKALGVEPEALERALKPVTAYEAIHENRQLVLLGDPGSGKSTLTRRMAGMLASVAVAELDDAEADWQGSLGGVFTEWRLPIRVALSKWAARLAKDAAGVANDLIEECLLVLRDTGDMGEERARTYLLDHLIASPPSVLILLDGLDEVPDKAQRKTVLSAVKHFCQTYADVPMVVTCRVRPYQDPSYRLPLPGFTLAPLSASCIGAFLRRWHDELTWVGRPLDLALKARRRLEEAIADRARPELREMAGTPLLLTMMARVNYDSGLPGSRAELYEEYIKKLLYEWEKRRQGDNSEDTGLEKLLTKAGLGLDELHGALNRLAYSVHGQKGRREKVAIPAAQMSDAFKALYLTRHPDQRGKAAEWAEEVLEFIDSRSGLLHATEEGTLYEFPHLSFQEYLAARAIAASSEHVARIREKIDDATWREVVLLALGYQIYVQKIPDNAVQAMWDGMPDEAVGTEIQRRRVLLLGEAYVRLLGLSRARQSEAKAAGEVMRRMPELLQQAMQRSALDKTAGDAKTLARQRLDAGLLLADLDPGEPLMDDFVDIPGLGEIGRYPVTNREFKRFMDEGGYRQDKPWWSQKAKAELSSLLRSERPAPRYWDDSRFNHATQPVVGVSWYEAVAYCAWLTKKLQAENPNAEVRLPTLEEWRQVAGPLTYPWGNDFYPARANSEESGLGQTTPVDMHPDGKTPTGVWDMGGNVWEWTKTPAKDWKGAYVLSGGAYWNDAKNIGSAARGWDDPRDWDVDGGFRVLVVPVSRSG